MMSDVMQGSRDVDFKFPFKPYDIQNKFMSCLFDTLENGKVGVFESPTGTGKSLSLICGSLTWLRDFKEREKNNLQKEIYEIESKNDDSKDWFVAHSEKMEKLEQLAESKTKLNALEQEEGRIKQLNENSTKKRKQNDMQFRDLMRNAKKFQENDHMVNEEAYLSDSEFLPFDFNLKTDDDYQSNDEDDTVDKNSLKIFYCSRTHSQLTQFVREVQKSPFGKDARVITLGSRQNLCINENVRKLNHLSLMNEKCVEMQKNKKQSGKVLVENKKTAKNKSTCPFFKLYNMNNLSDYSLVEVQDIEQIVESGKEMKACAYYSMRLSVPDAEIVILPYNILLQKSMRVASGIILKDNIVIVDEAHNLLETISTIHSVILYGSQISSCFNQLTHYMERYRSRLNAFNLLCIKQILSILSAFVEFLGGSTQSTVNAKLPKGEQTTQIYSLVQFLTTTQIENLNFFSILQYCEKSLIANKLSGFSAMNYQTITYTKCTSNSKTPLATFLENQNSKKNTENRVQQSNEEFSSSASFTSIQEFLKCLTNSNKDGRIIVDKRETLKESSLKFLLLNPALYFFDVVKEARSIILAGGTMHPVSEFTESLFKAAGIKDENIELFSCGHVIDKDHLLPLILQSGPSNVNFDFTYKNRDNVKLIDELGRLTINLCSITPGGIVLFFPSYSYEEKVYTQWEKSGVILKLNAKKLVFREPKASSQMDQVLNDYAEAINNKSHVQNGAILLSIVGGKMSEGINFSDDLGRLVIMVGLPYPNIESPELKERMKYLQSIGKDGKQLPQSLCMRSVNQSIGRAIRHKHDYAAILLLDNRYLKQWVQSALPQWISQELKSYEKFGLMFGSLRKFYTNKKK